MSNPLADLLSLTRGPGALASDLRAIAEAVSSVPRIEEKLARLLLALEPVARDVECVRETVVPQQERVAHIEQMMEGLQQRVIVIERAVLHLESKVDGAMKLLPDPDDDRGVLSKAKDALSGS
ncbi:MAG: hypothetical protein M3Z06_16510 [Actinomycetota bacterium]|nr:hypothetical protein [Actinomycetota bacterium]